ncbi:MAG: hypothetical protein QW057_08210 [Candidatus Bathyarchaeia archaeon]
MIARIGLAAIGIWEQVAPTAEGLRRLRQRAQRCNVWFTKLRGTERRYMDAVIKVVRVIRSSLLRRVVGAIVKKLLDAMRGAGGDILLMTGTVGKPLAERLSCIAQGWGHKSAAGWAKEQGFIRYLTVMYVNTLSLSVMRYE